MTSYLWIVLIGALLISRSQEFDLGDAIDDPVPTSKPDPKPPETGGGGLDLGDALPDPNKPKAEDPNKPKAEDPKPPETGGGGLDLGDALPDKPNAEDPNKPKAEDPMKPPAPAPDGGEFSDSELEEAGKELNPDGGRARVNSGGTTDNQDDQPKAAEGGQMAAIISAVAVAVFGAASSYFAYQKKKLCFKMQGGNDPESGRNQSGTQSDPQAFSNLLRSS